MMSPKTKLQKEDVEECYPFNSDNITKLVRDETCIKMCPKTVTDWLEMKPKSKRIQNINRSSGDETCLKKRSIISTNWLQMKLASERLR